MPSPPLNPTSPSLPRLLLLQLTFPQALILLLPATSGPFGEGTPQASFPSADPGEKLPAQTRGNYFNFMSHGFHSHKVDLKMKSVLTVCVQRVKIFVFITTPETRLWSL